MATRRPRTCPGGRGQTPAVERAKARANRPQTSPAMAAAAAASASATASATARACAASRGKRKRKETAGGFPQSIPRHRHPTVYPRCARYHHSSLRRRRRRRRAFLLRTRVFFSRFFARPRPLEELLPHPSASKARCCRCSASSSLSHAAQPVFPCCFFVCQYRSKHHTKHNRGQNRDTRQSRE